MFNPGGHLSAGFNVEAEPSPTQYAQTRWLAKRAEGRSQPQSTIPVSSGKPGEARIR